MPSMASSPRTRTVSLSSPSRRQVVTPMRFGGAHCAWIEGHVMPVVWKRRHGAGWVFYSALGHVAAESDRPEMATILRRRPRGR